MKQYLKNLSLIILMVLLTLILSTVAFYSIMGSSLMNADFYINSMSRAEKNNGYLTTVAKEAQQNLIFKGTLSGLDKSVFEGLLTTEVVSSLASEQTSYIIVGSERPELEKIKATIRSRALEENPELDTFALDEFVTFIGEVIASDVSIPFMQDAFPFISSFFESTYKYVICGSLIVAAGLFIAIWFLSDKGKRKRVRNAMFVVSAAGILLLLVGVIAYFLDEAAVFNFSTQNLRVFLSTAKKLIAAAFLFAGAGFVVLSAILQIAISIVKKEKKMKILIINSGSSSLKYQLIDMQNEQVLAKGICDRIGVDGAQKHSSAGKGDFKVEKEIKTHADAAQIVIDTLTKGEYAVISSIDEIDAVGHRIVQGGDLFSHPELVTDEVIEKIEGLSSLAPLHAFPNAAGIRSCKAVMPSVPQVVVFDTAFHQTMPKYAYMYGLPMEYYDKYKIRRYGFHGTSHKYISQKAAEWLGKDVKDLRLVTLHLGNGSSLCAIKNGECIDTSMGLTPLEGPMMGTRCGSIDPAAVAIIMDKEHLTGEQMNEIMNKKSGVMAISGVSPDFRDVNAAADAGNENADLAIKMFAYQCKKILAGYIAVLGGVDAIVFTAGVGENRPETRKYITDGLEYLGIKIDLEKNDVMGKDVDITAEGATVKTLILTTNEELMIARETLALISK